MKTRLWWFAVAFAMLAVQGCKKDEGHTPATSTPAATVTMTASKSEVVANGVNTVTLTLTNTAGGSVTVTTSKGTFAGGGQSVTLSQASATIVLVTCNAATDTTCAGTAVITATGAQTSSVSVVFGTLAAMCNAACSVDLSCAGLSCTGTTGTGTCSTTNPSACVVSGGGGGGGGGGGSTTPSLTVTPSRTRLPATGSATTTVTVLASNGTSPVSGAAVTLSTSLGTLSATNATTGSDGKATVTFSAGSALGVATITATTTSPALTGTGTITIPRLGAIQLPASAVQYQVLGVKGSGFQESGWLQVQVIDDAGNPYPDGLTVHFEHQPLGGSTFSEPTTTTGCTSFSTCVRTDAATSSGGDPPDSNGLATVWIHSGTLAGTLAVNVSAAGSTTAAGAVTASMPTMAVVGARASGSNFGVYCYPRNVPALAEGDCQRSSVDAPFTCEAVLGDRFGNVLGTQTQVIVWPETALTGVVTTTPAYDTTKGPSIQKDLGIAIQTFGTLADLPIDVPPQPGEPFYDLGSPDICNVQVHNPRDGVVTIVAIADGEEAFFDSNGNGVYDLGEPFVDQGEPFVDVDDDGVWNDGTAQGTLPEPFLDVDGDGKWTPSDGKWNASAKIWTQTVVVYTGAPATIMPTATTYLGTRWADDTFAGACTPSAAPAAFAVAASSTAVPPVPPSQTYYVVASDRNLNLLHTGTTYDVSVAAGTIKAEYQGMASYADDVGFFYRYWPCDKNGACSQRCTATGLALPCVMTPSLLNFSCGVASPVVITAGSSPDPGTDRVDFTVKTPWNVYGTGKFALGTRYLSGTSR